MGIGTDVIDQHPSFDGKAKGGCSGRDFLIYSNEITKFIDGGVILNIGSAVTGPEVLLKALSMAANAGSTPNNIITADFDLRAHQPGAMSDESKEGYCGLSVAYTNIGDFKKAIEFSKKYLKIV